MKRRQQVNLMIDASMRENEANLREKKSHYQMAVVSMHIKYLKNKF